MGTAFATNESTDVLFVLADEVGQRIDKLLASKFSHYSRTYFQHLIEIGCVLLNGQPIKKRICPELGDEIEICFQAIEGPSLQAENIPLDILFEDEHIIAINKKCGMVTHPAPGHYSGTFVNALLYHCQNLSPGSDPLRPGIVHRLDKETTGVLIAAKTMTAHQKLIELFSSRKMAKTYLSICLGHPANGQISAPIGRHPFNRKEMAVIETGKEAISHITTLATSQDLSLVMIKPKTGRTHQIRVHLKHVGCPILGDNTYGNTSLNERFETQRVYLHAYRLEFIHPITLEKMLIQAPIPEDFKSWIAKIST